MIDRLLRRFYRWRWPKCSCGEHRVAPGCRMELAGVSHGHTPCFHCDTFGQFQRPYPQASTGSEATNG